MYVMLAAGQVPMNVGTLVDHVATTLLEGKLGLLTKDMYGIACAGVTAAVLASRLFNAVTVQTTCTEKEYVHADVLYALRV
jgi:hypothetical protein